MAYVFRYFRSTSSSKTQNDLASERVVCKKIENRRTLTYYVEYCLIFTVLNLLSDTLYIGYLLFITCYLLLTITCNIAI